MGDKFHPAKLFLPIGNFFGLLPLVKFFSTKELTDCLVGAGFEIDHHWQPSEKSAVLIVAKKSV